MTQPEALGYAVSLEARGFVAEAAELRRLHKENKELRRVLYQLDEDDDCVAIVNKGMGGIEWLRNPLPDDTPLYTAPPSIETAVLTEREACAKLCDELGEKGYVAEGCAKAIRARGEK